MLCFMSDSCPFAKWCISFIFTLQRYSFFFIYTRKTAFIFQKNALFYVYFLQWEKAPLFTRCTYVHTITKQHPEHNITTCSTHTTPTHCTRWEHNTTTHNNNLNTWTHYTHNRHTRQGKHKATQWIPEQVDTVHSAHSGQGKENTRQRNENMHRHMNRHTTQEKTEDTCICIINKKYKNKI